MNRKKFLMTVGVIAGVFLGMKYVFPVMLPFFCGFLLAEIIHPVAYGMAKTKFGKTLHLTESGIGGVRAYGDFWQGRIILPGKSGTVCGIIS